MEKTDKTPRTVDEYIASCPAEVQPRMKLMRQTLLCAAPEAQEKISWGMATYVLHGNLVHFSAHTHHMGFHPAPSAVVAFQERLGEYSCSKGTVRFPYDKPLPLELIADMVRFRVEEQLAHHRVKEEEKAAKKRREKVERKGP